MGKIPELGGIPERGSPVSKTGNRVGARPPRLSSTQKSPVSKTGDSRRRPATAIAKRLLRVPLTVNWTTAHRMLALPRMLA